MLLPFGIDVQGFCWISFPLYKSNFSEGKISSLTSQLLWDSTSSDRHASSFWNWCPGFLLDFFSFVQVQHLGGENIFPYIPTPLRFQFFWQTCFFLLELMSRVSVGFLFLCTSPTSQRGKYLPLHHNSFEISILLTDMLLPFGIDVQDFCWISFPLYKSNFSEGKISSLTSQLLWDFNSSDRHASSFWNWCPGFLLDFFSFVQVQLLGGENIFPYIPTPLRFQFFWQTCFFLLELMSRVSVGFLFLCTSPTSRREKYLPLHPNSFEIPLLLTDMLLPFGIDIQGFSWISFPLYKSNFSEGKISSLTSQPLWDFTSSDRHASSFWNWCPGLPHNTFGLILLGKIWTPFCP